MVLRAVAAVVLAALLAWLGGLVLGEYPMVNPGIQWLPILGGAGLGGMVGWVVNRMWGGVPPVWMALVAAGIATWGEVRAVQADADGGAWPTDGWMAIAAAGALALYTVFSAARSARSA